MEVWQGWGRSPPGGGGEKQRPGRGKEVGSPHRRKQADNAGIARPPIQLPRKQLDTAAVARLGARPSAPSRAATERESMG